MIHNLLHTLPVSLIFCTIVMGFLLMYERKNMRVKPNGVKIISGSAKMKLTLPAAKIFPSCRI